MSESSRPTRKRKLPAKYQGGATADEIATSEATSQPLGHTNLPTPPPPAPPTTTPPISPQQPPKKRGRKPKPRVIEPPVLPAVVVIPEADSLRTAVVRGDADDTEAFFKAAVETMESLYEETYISDNEEGDPVMKTRRRARLKKPKGMSEAQAEKQREQSAFAASIPDPKTVIFEAMKEGPKRDPRPILPENTDVTSPYALFSLFWTDEIFEILANNTNLYAEQQETHRGWYATNADEMRVFVGIEFGSLFSTGCSIRPW